MKERAMKAMQEKRSNGLDALRILCMFMIVCVHAYNHGGILDAVEKGSVNHVLANVMYSLGLVSTNCFVLVSGYFHCTSKFKLKRIVTMWLEVFVYSAGIYALACLCGLEKLSLKALAGVLLPVSSKQYWFVTAYVLLQIFAPFLNRLIRAMDRKAHLLCCLTMVGVFCVWNNAAYVVFGNDFTEMNYGYSVYWFCVLYFLAAYFRKYVPQRIKRQKYMLPGYVLLVLLLAFTRVVSSFIDDRLLSYILSPSIFSQRYSILLLPASLCLFQFFRGGGDFRKSREDDLGRVPADLCRLSDPR